MCKVNLSILNTINIIRKNILFYLIIIMYFLSVNVYSQKYNVFTGADRIVSDKFDLIKNKNISIVTNHSAVLKNGIHLVDTLYNSKNVHIKALFAPEHGIRGDTPDGHSIKDGIDIKTNLPIFSLYGKNRKPTEEMLKGTDILIFDIQDVGARYYTFISTLYYSLIAAAENNIPILVLDRPNPINGITVDGPIRKEEYKSFVAIAPIPIQHGMTVGELAILFNSEGWLAESNLKADLKVVKMIGWNRELFYDDYNLKWIDPSPNIPSLNTALMYPGMCLLEGVNVSEGRGTYSPFLTFGAPYINASELLDELNKFNHEGLELSRTSFTPISITNMSTNPKYIGEICNGISILVTDRKKINALRFGIIVLVSIHRLYSNDFSFTNNRIDKLFGAEYLREMVMKNYSPDEIFKKWESDLEQFKILRKKYLIY